MKYLKLYEDLTFGIDRMCSEYDIENYTINKDGTIDEADMVRMDKPSMPEVTFGTNITLAYNTGAAFSFLSGTGDWHRWFFAGFSFLVSFILVVWLWRTPKKDKLQSTGVSLILGGAVGNLLDRGLHGHVIDFIDVYYGHHHFATFNIADSVICIGAGLLILDLLIHRE